MASKRFRSPRPAKLDGANFEIERQILPPLLGYKSEKVLDFQLMEQFPERRRSDRRPAHS
jgi:hypothetical protein